MKACPVVGVRASAGGVEACSELQNSNGDPDIARRLREQERKNREQERTIQLLEEARCDYAPYGCVTPDSRGGVPEMSARRKTEDALRASEQTLRKFSRVVEQSPVCIVITNTAGEIEYVNPRFTEVTGYSPEEALGRNPRVLKSGRHPPEFYRQMWETITAGDDWRGEFCNRKKSGELYWEAAVIAPIKNEHGTVTHFVALKEDVTEIKQLQREVLHISEREQARIGRDLHDGACQNLASLAILADAAAKDLDHEKSKTAASIREIAGILRETVNEIRRLATGLFPVKIEQRGLEWALRDLAEETIARSRIACRFIMRQPVAITDPNNAIHLYRIAQEAISNAVRHGHATHISIKLTEDDGLVQLTIQDDGGGLPRRLKKNGLGLHTMHYRAKMLGGWLDVSHAPAHGTVVVCSFPISPESFVR